MAMASPLHLAAGKGDVASLKALIAECALACMLAYLLDRLLACFPMCRIPCLHAGMLACLLAD